MSTTVVTWVLDSNSKHEISSKEHLLQLMHSGTLYENQGSFPTDFMRGSYIQTADIDLEHDSNIVPIGINLNKFVYAEYDGGNFSISNWTYVDPNYASPTENCEAYTGLFGNINTCVVKNVKLSGLWILHGFHIHGGMVIGKVDNSTVSNISCDFEAGSEILQGETSVTSSCVGGIFGSATNDQIYGLTIEGEVALVPSPNSTSGRTGGIIGYMYLGSVTLIRNLATFTNTLTNYEVGGCIGNIFRASCEKVLCAMTGNLYAVHKGGGVFGMCRLDAAGNYLDKVVNSMKGDIILQPAGIGGGIFGRYQGSSTTPLSNLMNYMKGNIITESAGGQRCGGMIGHCGSGDVTMTSSIVAMNGDVQNSVVGIMTNPVSLVVTIDTSFGLTFDTDNYSTTTPVTGVPLDENYYNLPYFALTGTDPSGLSYDWDFVFGNSKTIQFILTPRAINIIASYDALPGASEYRLTVKKKGHKQLRTIDGITDTTYNIQSLKPDSEYVLKLYSTLDGLTYDLYLEGTQKTSLNSSSSYDKSDFVNVHGRFDLSSLGTDSARELYGVMNDIFDTGESVTVPMSGGLSKPAKFVKRGESASIVGEDALLVAFDESAGSAQSVTMTLSDTSSLVLTFDDTKGSINVAGSDYFPGDYTVVDGKKMTFVDI